MIGARAIPVALLALASAVLASRVVAQPPASFEEALLEARAPAEGARLGSTVAVSADASVVLAGCERGGARVFVRSAGRWQLDAELVTSARRAVSVAIVPDGSLAVIGTPHEGPGSVHVFARTESGWVEAAVLVPPDRARADMLGASVAISRDGLRIAAGAPRDDLAGAADAGSVHVFLRTPEGWAHEAMLVARDASRLDMLGSSIAISDDGARLIAGAPGDDTAAGEDAGSARTFERDATGWREVGSLEAGDAARRDLFGTSVAISGDGALALVGAPGDDAEGVENAGSALVVAWVDGWQEEAQLVAAPDGTGRPPRGLVGGAVALSADGSRAIVGARADLGGRARVYARAPRWAALTTLEAYRPAAEASFGAAVALSADGGTAVVGAPADASAGTAAAGTVRVLALARIDGSVPWDRVAVRVTADPGERAWLGAHECAPDCGEEIDPGEITLRADRAGPPVRLYLREPVALRVSRVSRESERIGGGVVLGAGWTLALALALGVGIGWDCGGGDCAGSRAWIGIGLGVAPAAIATLLGIALVARSDGTRVEGRLRSGARIGPRGDGDRDARVAVSLLAIVPVLAGGAAAATLLTPIARSSPSFGGLLGLVIGTPVSIVGTTLLSSLIVTGIGSAMGGRGHFGGAVLGFLVGGALGVAVMAASYHLAFGGAGDAFAIHAVGASVGVLLAGIGAIVGYEVWDASARGEDEIVILPIAAACADGGTLGVAGAF